jgi:protein-tyrosine phosphatase
VGSMIRLFRSLFRRKPLVYPAPETLIVRLPDDPPDRILSLEGAVNFRDLGGYKTADGRRLRRGLVYRSGSLGRLTDSDIVQMGEIGVKLVCDLRSIEELTDEPDRLSWQPAPAYAHLPLTVEDERRSRLRALLFDPASVPAMLPDMYTRIMLDNNANLFGDLLRRLTDPANLPTVIHCTAGKDRTGIAAALLLACLNVPDDVIAADYSLSNLYFQTFMAYGMRALHRLRWLIRAENLQPLFVADPVNIQTALDHVRRKYGSVESYLRHAAGLSESELAALRANLLE